MMLVVIACVDFVMAVAAVIAGNLWLAAAMAAIGLGLLTIDRVTR